MLQPRCLACLACLRHQNLCNPSHVTLSIGACLQAGIWNLVWELLHSIINFQAYESSTHSYRLVLWQREAGFLLWYLSTPCTSIAELLDPRSDIDFHLMFLSISKNEHSEHHSGPSGRNEGQIEALCSLSLSSFSSFRFQSLQAWPTPSLSVDHDV